MGFFKRPLSEEHELRELCREVGSNWLKSELGLVSKDYINDIVVPKLGEVRRLYQIVVDGAGQKRADAIIQDSAKFAAGTVMAHGANVVTAIQAAEQFLEQNLAE